MCVGVGSEYGRGRNLGNHEIFKTPTQRSLQNVYAKLLNLGGQSSFFCELETDGVELENKWSRHDAKRRIKQTFSILLLYRRVKERPIWLIF